MDGVGRRSLTWAAESWPSPSSSAILNCWVKGFQLDARVIDGEAPVHSHHVPVAPVLPSVNFPAQRLLIRNPAVQALPGQHSDFNFSHVQPTPMLGGVVKLQPFRNPSGRGRWERLVQRRRAVGVQVIQDQTHHRDLRIGFIHQPAHLKGEVLHRAPLGHRHLPPSCQRLAGQEQVSSALSAVPLFLPHRTSRLRRKGRLGVSQGGCTGLTVRI